MPSPLFVKYTTPSGIHYVYDLGTGKIVRVGDVSYEILDDFCMLTDEEVVDVYADLGRDAVREALAELREVQQQGILCDHDPVVPERAVAFSREDELLNVADFFASTPGTLVLGITERCNLRCDYCPYGEHYDRFRPHGDSDMPTEVAERALIDHIRRSSGKISIAFYGGEPLLNFPLVEHCILFAEQEAQKVGKAANLVFSITTNGTLLTDKRIGFLVDHQVLVAISLDGAENAHDRYRVFHDKHGDGKRVGSFNIVMKNIDRFVELYPNYRRRGIFMVLTPPYDLDETRALVDRLWPDFPFSRVTFVAQEYGETFSENGVRPKQVGCIPDIKCPSSGNGDNAGDSLPTTVMPLPILQPSNCHSCSAGSTTEGMLPTRNCGGSVTRDDELPVLTPPVEVRNQLNGQSSGDQPDRDMVDAAELKAAGMRFINARIDHGSEARHREPFGDMAFGAMLQVIHKRPIDEQRRTRMVNYKCRPGAVRLFCDIHGNYFTCEKCESTDILSLGNVWTGPSIRDSERQLELFRHVADCGNCVVQRTCQNCYVGVYQKPGDGAVAVNGDAFDFKCSAQRSQLAGLLGQYSLIMEGNPDAFAIDEEREKEELRITSEVATWFDMDDGQEPIGEECLYPHEFELE